jgi:hypothetical protein
MIGIGETSNHPMEKIPALYWRMKTSDRTMDRDEIRKEARRLKAKMKIWIFAASWSIRWIRLIGGMEENRLLPFVQKLFYDRKQETRGSNMSIKRELARTIASAAPTINEDESGGYNPLSMIAYNSEVYICAKSNHGGAVWKQIATGGDVWTRITETTSSRSAADGEYILVNSAFTTITLPAPADNLRIAAKLIAAESEGIEILTNTGGVMIDGVDRSSTGYAITAQYASVALLSDGSNWFII